MPTIQYLQTLLQGINDKKGTENCAHCALRFDKHVAEGENLGLGPVPAERANLFTHPLFRKGEIVKSSTKDQRLIDRSSPPPTDYRMICSLEDDDKSQYHIDLTVEMSAKEEVRFVPANLADLNSKLLTSRRRKKDGSAYGFILLTHEKKTNTAHLINYYIDESNQIYFIDSQRGNPQEQILTRLNMQGYRPEIFYLPSLPPEGFKLKNEEIITLKQEKTEIPESLISDDLKDNSECKEILQRIKTNPASASTWHELATLLFAKNAYQQAEIAAQKCLSFDGNNERCWSLLGDVYWSPGPKYDLKKGFDSFLKSFDIKSDPIVLKQLSKGFVQNMGTESERRRLVDDFLRAIGQGTKEADIWYVAGVVCQEGIFTRKNFKKAFKCFKKATELNENFVDAWLKLGNCISIHKSGSRTLGKAYTQKGEFLCYKKIAEITGAPHWWTKLAEFYTQGIGTEVNKKEAEACLDKAKIASANLQNNNQPLPSSGLIPTLPLLAQRHQFQVSPPHQVPPPPQRLPQTQQQMPPEQPVPPQQSVPPQHRPPQYPVPPMLPQHMLQIFQLRTPQRLQHQVPPPPQRLPQLVPPKQQVPPPPQQKLPPEQPVPQTPPLTGQSSPTMLFNPMHRSSPPPNHNAPKTTPQANHFSPEVASNLRYSGSPSPLPDHDSQLAALELKEQEIQLLKAQNENLKQLLALKEKELVALKAPGVNLNRGPIR